MEFWALSHTAFGSFPPNPDQRNWLWTFFLLGDSRPHAMSLTTRADTMADNDSRTCNLTTYFNES